MKTGTITINIGIAQMIASLLFGIAMGIGFGINEDVFQNYVARGIAAHPEVHDADSPDKIWRYAQRAHFHATGISAFSLALVALMLLSHMKRSVVGMASLFLGFGGWYPMAWLAMFIMAPDIGRQAAHEHMVTHAIVYVSVGGLLVGLALCLGGLWAKGFREQDSGEGGIFTRRWSKTTIRSGD